jgi:uncharacterized protein GlcG (DUF336 family)
MGAALAAESQALPVPAALPYDIPYGPPITLDQAKTAVNGALAESAKHHWKESCAVVEGNGQLVLFEKEDDTQYASTKIALDKAKSAAFYRRSTTVFHNAMEHGYPYVLRLADANPVPGGEPIVMGGKVIGGLGCSGGTGGQDVVVVKAGLKALGAE